MEIKELDPQKIRLVAFDLDGTLTQHRSPLEPATKEMLERLSEKYKLLMIGAGACRRIYNQMGEFPIDIIGNYGLQYAEYDKSAKDIVIKAENTLPCDRASVEARTNIIRQRHGFTKYYGDCVEFHPSGAVTLPILGTKAPIEEKLAFDPDRSRRRAFYKEVCDLFPEYSVFVGGSSSFDMVSAPYNKYYALANYCRDNGISHDEVLYCGDDYEPGGNDESVYKSDFPFMKIDDYRTTPEKLAKLYK